MAQARSGKFLLAIAAVGGAAPAAAATATTGLGVSATVLPSCTVSTETRTATPTVTCSNLGGGEIAVRTAPVSGTTAPRPASDDPLQVRDAASADGVSYVTVTY